MRLLAAVGASLLLVMTACGTSEEPLASTETTAPPMSSSSTSAGEPETSSDELTADTPINAGGLGPLKAGMTLAEVRGAAAPRELVLEGFEDFDGYCWFAAVEGLEEDFSLLFLAPTRTEPVADAEDGILGRVSVEAELQQSPARTARDVGVGSTKAEVEAAYPDQVKATPHEYTEGGEYLDVGATDDRDRRLLRFETGADGKVSAIHGGLTDAAQLVEGCA